MAEIEKECWWFIDTFENTGEYNMALDGYLAENVKKEPIVRFYSWKPFCLSLGYAQKDEIFDHKKLRENNIDIVRRPTGGRAVLHTDEVTYSVIIPSSHALFSLKTTVLYKSISSALYKGLQYLGINALIEKNKRDTTRSEKNSPYCFSSAARYEIKYNNSKLIGSAQRRFGSSVLQHGSIPLNDYPFELDSFIIEGTNNILKKSNRSLSGLLGRNVLYSEVVSSIKRGFEDTFDIIFREKNISSSIIIKNLPGKYRINN